MSLRCRAEFDECLKRTTERIRQRLEEESGEPVLTAILNQLSAIAAWTAGGRNVRRANRKRIIMGLQAHRELAHLPVEQDLVLAFHNYIER